MRSVDTRFWEDGWVRKLNALDRYLFLYILTNTHTNWCGIYELDLPLMAFECGLDKEDLERCMLPRLSPKVIYVDGWVYIPNYKKYHLNKTDSTQLGYERAFKQVPEEIRLRIKEIDSKGVVPPRPPSSAFALPLPKGEDKSSQEYEVVTEDEKPPRTKKDTSYLSVFSLWGKYPLNWKQNRTEIAAAQNILAEHGLEKARTALVFYGVNQYQEHCPQILKPSDLDRKWVNLKAYKDKI